MNLSKEHIDRLIKKHSRYGMENGKYVMDVDLESIINDVLNEDAPQDNAEDSARRTTGQS